MVGGIDDHRRLGGAQALQRVQGSGHEPRATQLEDRPKAGQLVGTERRQRGLVDTGERVAGGAGERLYPLTRDRAKPAVPLAGKYRLVDVPISNCINSGMRRIFLLTQFLSASLHRHAGRDYRAH